MSEISLSERDCLIRRLQHGEKHNRKVTDRKFYRRLLNHIASLESQLAARNQAAEAMGVLERLVSDINKITLTGPMFSDLYSVERSNGHRDGEIGEGGSLVEAVLKAGGEQQ